MAKDIGPGSVVVCVDASGTNPDCTPLIEGARYRVHSVRKYAFNWPDGSVTPGLYLYGVGNGWSYRISRFRPIDDGDAQIFREMIVPRKVKVHG